MSQILKTISFPKIIFKYSSVYDRGWKIWVKNYGHLNNGEYPEKVDILNYIAVGEKEWNKAGNSILSEMIKATGLSWSDEIITCYVVGKCRALSDPLTLMVWESDLDRFIDTLTHELIHQLICQDVNRHKLLPVADYVYDKYKNESLTTRIHIPIHAVHWHILIKLFGKDRLNKNIERSQNYEDYRKSWEIVEMEGYENLIEGFKKVAS